MADTVEAPKSIPEPEVTSNLENVLLDLLATPYPHVPNPPSVPKRASVALIVRIQPRYASWPSEATATAACTADTVEEKIRAFFRQDWVRGGDPEVLFIKRATRKGDRWTGHTALPGGRRDPEDANDQAAAVRETLEEVGINLSEENAIAVGNLPQRVVTTSWGKVPLMVLCPYVFLITLPGLASLRLQPTEVASTHWVPLRALLSPHQRTYEYQDVSNRLAKQEFGLKRSLMRLMLGRMRFAAIHLIPSESQYCAMIPGFIPEDEQNGTSTATTPLTNTISTLLTSSRRTTPPSHPTSSPLLLWGLTLGIVADFLELLPPHTALELWTYPTFTPWDVKSILWLLSYKFRQQKKLELATDGLGPQSQVQDSEGVPVDSPEQGEKYPEVGIGGLGAGTSHGSIRDAQAKRNSAIGVLLEGYYDIVQRAVVVAIAGRVSIVTMLGLTLWWWRRRRGS